MKTVEIDSDMSERKERVKSYMMDSDEIDLLEYVRVLWKHKFLILGFLVFGLIGGFIAAEIKGPTFVVEAVIAPKESENKSSVSNLSSLGALGGMVANQLNIAGNPGLEKIDILLSSRKFNAELIKKYDFLPNVFAQKWPERYRELYDSTNDEWSDQFVSPKLLSVGKVLKENYLDKEIDKKSNTMILKVSSSDSLFSETLMSNYLEYLNSYIQTDVKTETQEKIRYLESQLLSIGDPLLREKLQAMIAMEMEKMMLVSKEAYKVVDPQLCFRQHKEKMLFPPLFAFGLAFLCCTSLISVYVFESIRNKKE